MRSYVYPPPLALNHGGMGEAPRYVGGHLVHRVHLQPLTASTCPIETANCAVINQSHFLALLQPKTSSPTTCQKRHMLDPSKPNPYPTPLQSAATPLTRGLGLLAPRPVCKCCDKVRTELANLVYSATAVLAKECIKFGILCSIENPENSLCWIFLT